MPVIAIIIALIVGGGAWWWRIQRARDAASTLIDLAGKARGAYSRSRFRQKAGSSILSGVDHPGSAAAILLYGLSELKRPIIVSDEDAIDAELRDVCGMNQRDRDEAVAFAAWACAEVADLNEVIRRFAPLWKAQLDRDECKNLIDMAIRIAERGGPPTDAQKASIKRLSENLLLLH